MFSLPTALDLMAYADGELDAADAERVRAYLVQDERARRWLETMGRLDAASRRAMMLQAPRTLAPGILARPESAWRMRIPWAARVAAALLIGLGLYGMIKWSNRGPGSAAAPVEALPASWTSEVSRVHTRCAAHAAHLNALFPRDLIALPKKVEEYAGCSAQCPDLEKMGYEFAGAAPCPAGGTRTVHLLYRSRGVPGACVSLFIQKYARQLEIEKGRTYFAPGPDRKTPMIVWRDDNVMYCLVGDDVEPVKLAARTMGKDPSS